MSTSTKPPTSYRLLPKSAELDRLKEDEKNRSHPWRRWGPYVPYRQWGTVREDYSDDGSCWDYFSHDQARSRAYRWGEDGIFGISDINCQLCFSVAMWNKRDPILKERLYGLTGNQGNNAEDVKECYYHLNALPSHAYLKSLYKYPQRPFPYETLMRQSRKRGRGEPEFELIDTGIFDRNEYFDVFIEYAKGSPDDILIRITVFNRGYYPAPFFLLPTLYFRNTWSWGRIGLDYPSKPRMFLDRNGWISTDHSEMERFSLAADPRNRKGVTLFTENETNTNKLYNYETAYPYLKDSFHEYLIHRNFAAVNPMPTGTKACFLSKAMIRARSSEVFRFRLFNEKSIPKNLFGAEFDALFNKRIQENNNFYSGISPDELSPFEQRLYEDAHAGLIWTKQFFYYNVKEWMEGDPAQPPPSEQRKAGSRNKGWSHLYNKDIISMPDKWEYPWYAAWDLAFHMIPFATIDPAFSKHQLLLMLREWYMHPNGQIPAYEFAFSDVNPPVHAWAVWRVYKITGPRGKRDRKFLACAFHKLLLNFTWWVNQKDENDNNLFTGGFLGLDNIGVFDRSPPFPIGEELEQADATAWMAFYCSNMLAIALELASEDSSYSDIASKFFEHFVAISDAINNFEGTGLWNKLDGFYYDQIHFADGRVQQLRVRSLIGIIPLLAVGIVEDEVLNKLPDFKERLDWFLNHNKVLAKNTQYRRNGDVGYSGLRLISIPSKDQLRRMLTKILDENEFLSEFGIRSLSKVHKDHPYILKAGSREYRVDYTPGESDTTLFGGNSNWRGPIWFPINYLIIEALERYHHFYGDSFKIEFPSGSGNKMNLLQVSQELSKRLSAIFLPNSLGQRPWANGCSLYNHDPHWRNLNLFHEYFHGDSGKGLGACHQTGWTALVTRCLEKIAGTRRD